MVTIFPSIEQQDAAIRAAWPTFRLITRTDRTATWQGTLKPFMLAYEVRVSHRIPLVIERIDPLRQQPEVRVVTPPLKPRRGDAEGPLPHVYVDRAGDPVLCLFDHETGEWTPFRLLAETTIPWALDWLGCYEGWRASGEWSGGGRHAPLLDEQEARQ
ncbi:hypothetical protein BHAOGJBA_0794 [Methylobacterium hispanicum]|uniref:Type II CBASS E2 protein domain-containing protein n=1 Tax=Methylobacterium hispanicum TaxID=270350 RepID=A0AAV4ZGT3_9HYPH|nr:hypothetical protein BHAOGJBA_0794 [Methylobacterium hispanicum]